MKESIWTYVLASSGIGFGWLLNELSQIIRGKKEDKKIKKKVLFYLLELYFTLKKLDTSHYIDIVTSKIAERLPPGEQNKEIEESLAEFYQQLIGNLQEKESAKRLKELETNYKKSLEDLAAVDPITSYFLFGENEFFKIIDILSNYVNSIKSEFPDDLSNIDSFKKNILDFLKPEFLANTLENLEGKIRQVSLGIDIFTWYKAKKVIDKQNKPIDENQLKVLTKYLDTFIPK